MFEAEKSGEYEPVKIRKRERNHANGEYAGNGSEAANGTESTEAEWEEDRISEEGAVWPLRQGRIVDWPCFYALMIHVHNTVNPPFHTPIMLIAEPVWTVKEREKVTQFFFEKFKVPAFTIVDAAVAASWAFSLPTAVVVDVGHGKADVSCITDFVVQEVGRSLAVPGCGGEALTEHLAEILKGRKGFTRAVCEQLKKSAICEILPSETDLPSYDTTVTEPPANPAAAASTGADGLAPGQRKPSVAGELPRGPGPDTQVGEEQNLDADDDGVLDIASIVTGGNMQDYLAQKEREKQERAAAKQQKKAGEVPQAAVNRPARLPNNKRTRNTFIYEDFELHDAMKKAGMDSRGMANMQSALDEGPNKRQKTPEATTAGVDKPVEVAPLQVEAAADTSPIGGFKREIEVGLERFQAASGGMLDRLADAIFRTVQCCSEVNKRSELWDSLIIVGNGAKIRGFKEALLHTLQAKYIISPSSATMFTSELPSSFSTPLATGTNTPRLGLHNQPPHTSGANPLLMAATTAQNPHLPPAPSTLPQHTLAYSSHTSHAQSPTSIRLARIPDYFPEWKEAGYDEATFLGAQVCGKVLFMVDGGMSKGYMTRTDYNEQGPMGIHEITIPVVTDCLNVNVRKGKWSFAAADSGRCVLRQMAALYESVNDARTSEVLYIMVSSCNMVKMDFRLSSGGDKCTVKLTALQVARKAACSSTGCGTRRSSSEWIMNGSKGHLELTA
nr:actin-like protein arp9 [Quercus suber]